MTNRRPPPRATPERLIEAAGQVFAHRGYQNATVREICKLAHANIAAVKYHFRDKKGLYTESLAHWARLGIEKYPPTGGLPPTAPPQKRLHAFIRAMVFRILAEDHPAWHGKLMAREIAEPSPIFDALVRNQIKPQHRLLSDILARMLHRRPDHDEVQRCLMSVIGQILIYHHARSIVERLIPALAFGPRQLDELADHITRFSLAGIRDRRRQGATR